MARSRRSDPPPDVTLRRDAAGRTYPRQSLRTAAAQARRLVAASGELDELIATVGRDRRRLIRLYSTKMCPSGPTGAWIATEDTDWIVHPADASPAERDMIVCHELAHMLLNHQADQLGDTQRRMAGLVAPDIDPEVAVRFFSRHGYEDDMEAEAEQLATMLVTFMALNATERAMRTDTFSQRLR